MTLELEDKKKTEGTQILRSNDRLGAGNIYQFLGWTVIMEILLSFKKKIGEKKYIYIYISIDL